MRSFSKTSFKLLISAFLFTFFLLIYLSNPARAGVIVMDDFNDGTVNNLFGAGEGGLSGTSGITFVSTVAFGNTGYARGIGYDATSGGHGFYTSRTATQGLEQFRYVSFMIRSMVRGATAYAYVHDGTNVPKINISSFMIDGITTEYQKVVITTSVFYSAPVNWTTGGAAGNFEILAHPEIGSGIGTVYIDDIRFGTRPSPIWVDNFNDGTDPSLTGPTGLTHFSYIDNLGAASSSTLRGTYDRTLAYANRGFSYKIAFSSGSSTQYGIYTINFASSDITGTDALVFHVAGDANSAGTAVGIGIKDAGSRETIKLLNNIYLPGGILNGSFSEARIPIADFLAVDSLLDTTHILTFEVVFQYPGLATTISTSSLYFDNIRFVDTSTPTAPTALLNNGTAVGNGSVINYIATFTVTAAAGATDVTLEEVRFEHDGLTGGASWYTLGVDTDVADAAYGKYWNTATLQQGTSYQIRVKALDVQGNYSTLGPFTVEVSTWVNPVGVTGFQINATSVTVSLASNGNLPWTTYAVSTASFSASSSSSGQVTTLTLSNLTPNSPYTISARAFHGNLTSTTTAVTSTTTLVLVIVSSGGTVSAGGTTVVADAGVNITNTLLSDGTTQQVLSSTKTATVAYGNGVSLELPAGVLATIIPGSTGIQLTSTQTIPITNSDITLHPSSGTITVTVGSDSLSVSVSGDSIQDLSASLSTATAKTLLISLNPESGEIKVSLAPGALSQSASVRVKKPSSLPAAAPSLSPALSASAAPAFATGLGIGLEITLDKAIQPKLSVPITMKYRDIDAAGKNSDNLVIARYDDTSQKWLALSGAVDSSARSVTANTLHFSRFQLLAVTPATDVEQSRVFPNPLKFHQGHTEMTFKNLTPNASLKIYTYAGELVRDMNADASGFVRWDGRNRSGEKVSGGMYMVLIENGAGSKKVMRIGVEK